MVKTETVVPGTVGRIDSEITATAGELRELSELLESEMRTGFPKYGLKLIRWLGVEIVKINGSYGLKTSYLRQGGSNPPVLVEQYHFENHDRTHTVTVSYRYEDADVWKPAIDTVVDSLRFLVRPN